MPCIPTLVREEFLSLVGEKHPLRKAFLEGNPVRRFSGGPGPGLWRGLDTADFWWAPYGSGAGAGLPLPRCLPRGWGRLKTIFPEFFRHLRVLLHVARIQIEISGFGRPGWVLVEGPLTPPILVGSLGF